MHADEGRLRKVHEGVFCCRRLLCCWSLRLAALLKLLQLLPGCWSLTVDDHGNQANKNNSSQCREFSKAYLACRMDKGLMTPEKFENLGFRGG